MRDHADIDAIRRKHEAQVAYTKEKQGNFPYLFQSIQSNLRISDVDALFAALDAERGKVEKAHKAIDYAFHYIQQLPSGCDEEADEEDTSPCDMTAHIGGLILRRLEKALDELEADKILTGEGK